MVKVCRPHPTKRMPLDKMIIPHRAAYVRCLVRKAGEMSLINKEALISRFNDLCVGECCCCRYSTTTKSGCAVIDDSPEVDKHGHWIKDILTSTGGGSYATNRCSRCGWAYPTLETPYCPCCGAKMDEVIG